MPPPVATPHSHWQSHAPLDTPGYMPQAKSAPVGVMSDAVVRAKTGKSWPQWFALLDRAGCKSMTHKEIVARVGAQLEVPGWWQQMVTVAYERARGLREKYQAADGFQASASRTVDVPVDVLFAAWADPKRRRNWLGDVKLVVRKSTPDKSMRITWPNPPSHLDVYFVSKRLAKSQLAISHRKLADAKAVASMKAFWAGALSRMKEIVER